MDRKPCRIAFAMTKGGAGKTTTAAAFATELAKRGYKTLLVDTDSQSLVRHALGAEDAQIGLYELADGLPYNEVVYRFSDQPETSNTRKNLELVVSVGNLNKLQLGWTLAPEDREGQLLEIMEQVEAEQKYDFVLLDTSPTEGMINTNVFYYAHHIIVPVAVAPFHIYGLEDFIGIVERTKKRKAKRADSFLKISWVLPTLVDKRLRVSQILLDEIGKLVQPLTDCQLLEPIPKCAKTQECSIHGQSILEYAPQSRGGVAYMKAVEEVLNYVIKSKYARSVSA